MSIPTSTIDQNPADDIFGDPISYLASLGIEAEVVAETTLPEAA